MFECKTRASVFVMAALLVTASRAAADPPRLDLVWVDPTGLAIGTYEMVSKESSASLAALGADVTWTAAPPHGAVVGPESLVVIAVPTYHGERVPDRHVMGSTRRVSDGALAVWVFPEEVAWALGLRLDARATWNKLEEAEFGRGLARVASHEVLHALGAATHARAGLMTASLDRKALASKSRPRLDGATLASVRRTFDRGAVSASGAWTAGQLRSMPLSPVPELLAVPSAHR